MIIAFNKNTDIDEFFEDKQIYILSERYYEQLRIIEVDDCDGMVILMYFKEKDIKFILKDYLV